MAKKKQTVKRTNVHSDAVKDSIPPQKQVKVKKEKQVKVKKHQSFGSMLAAVAQARKERAQRINQHNNGKE